MKHIAVYLRVSTDDQSTASQRPDIDRWLTAYADGSEVEWYIDEGFSGKNTKRPAFKRMEDALLQGKVDRIVCWKLDRLGRSVVDLANLFQQCNDRNVALISIQDGLDLSTPAGRLVANIMASVAEYEREGIRARIKAGIAAARAKGKTWGGHVCKKPHRHLKQADVDFILANPQLTTRECARRLKIGKSTVSRIRQTSAPSHALDGEPQDASE